MNIQPKIFLYEILIRFNAGGFQGAHSKDLTQLVDMDEPEGSPLRVVSEREGDARVIEQAELEGLLGSENASILAEITRLQVIASQQATQISELTVALEACNAAAAAS